MSFTPDRFSTVFFAMVILFVVSCADKTEKKAAKPIQAKEVKAKEIKTLVQDKREAFALGDMNGDNIQDTAYVYTSSYYTTPFEGRPGEQEFAGCVDNKCYNRIKFSAGYPEILFENSLWGTVEPIGDLDGDGINEFIFQTNWWIGTHISIYIYSFDRKKRQWVILAQNWRYGEESYKGLVTKIDKTEFKFRIEYMDTIAGDLMKKDTLIRIKK